MSRPGRLAAFAARLGCTLTSVLAGAVAHGADAPAALERVEITGTSPAGDGRDSAAARSVVTRADITRHGDTSLADVLRRVPGITLTGTQGRAGEIRLHGLGSGYTQVLVNGEAVPGGFSLDSIAPGQIERIEVSRVATVDLGAQAIAGTLNIVLRQAARQRERELKASLGANAGRASAALEGQFSDRFDARTYALGASLSRKNEAWPVTITQRGSDAADTPVLERVTRRQAYGLADAIGLTPRVSWQWGEDDKLGLEALLRHTRFDDHSADQRDATLGPLPPFSSDTRRLELHTTLAQPRLTWKHLLDSGASLDMRLGLNLLRRVSSTRLLGRDESDRLAMDEQVGSTSSERGATAAGKLRLPWGEQHAIALGWDAEQARRVEARSQTQTSPIGRPVLDLDERHRTRLERLAFYAQDEWDWDETTSAYAGVRWAMLRTRTEGTGLDAPVGQRSAVFSPVLQLLWKPPALPGDQLRLALSRSYKAPRAVDLIPRRFVAIDNTPTTPDLQGNPALRPELAWGLDLAYVHAWPRQAGTLDVSASARRIRDVILDQLAFDDGAWVSRKANQGSASVFGLELDARLALRAAWPGAPDMDLRAGLSRNWSRVDQVPGPHNRLDAQVPLSANLGLDWRAPRQPLTLGGHLAWRGAMEARSSLTQTTASNTLRTLDLYALWKLDAATQLRVALSNVLAPHDRSTDTYADAAGSFRQDTDAPTRPGVRLGLELKY